MLGVIYKPYVPWLMLSKQLTDEVEQHTIKECNEPPKLKSYE